MARASSSSVPIGGVIHSPVTRELRIVEKNFKGNICPISSPEYDYRLYFANYQSSELLFFKFEAVLYFSTPFLSLTGFPTSSRRLDASTPRQRAHSVQHHPPPLPQPYSLLSSSPSPFSSRHDDDYDGDGDDDDDKYDDHSQENELPARAMWHSQGIPAC